MKSEALRLCAFTPADALELVGLSDSIGWQHTLADWQTSLAAGLVFGHRDTDGRILSSAAIYPYGSRLASIGQVIVRAEARRRGLGRAVFVQCLEQAPDRPVILTATPDGLPLYASLGFREVEDVIKLIAPTAEKMPASAHCPPMRDADLASVCALDRAAMGADRGVLLRERWKRADRGALLPDGTGFAWGTVQRAMLVIGPVIAPDEEGALRLIDAVARGYAGPLRIDVPARQAELIRTLRAEGFEHRDTHPLMLRGQGGLPGDRARVFAVATLAFG